MGIKKTYCAGSLLVVALFFGVNLNAKEAELEAGGVADKSQSSGSYSTNDGGLFDVSVSAGLKSGWEIIKEESTVSGDGNLGSSGASANWVDQGFSFSCVLSGMARPVGGGSGDGGPVTRPWSVTAGPKDFDYAIDPSEVRMPIGESASFTSTADGEAHESNWSVKKRTDLVWEEKGSGSSFSITPEDYITVFVKGTSSENETKSATVTAQAIGVLSVERYAYGDGDGEVKESEYGSYVKVGDTITFKAEPINGPFPEGYPVWSGEASGNSDTATVTFSSPSSSSQDTKTVTASCGTSSKSETVLVLSFLAGNEPEISSLNAPLPDENRSFIYPDEIVIGSFNGSDIDKDNIDREYEDGLLYNVLCDGAGEVSYSGGTTFTFMPQKNTSGNYGDANVSIYIKDDGKYYLDLEQLTQKLSTSFTTKDFGDVDYIEGNLGYGESFPGPFIVVSTPESSKSISFSAIPTDKFETNYPKWYVDGGYVSDDETFDCSFTGTSSGKSFTIGAKGKEDGKMCSVNVLAYHTSPKKDTSINLSAIGSTLDSVFGAMCKKKDGLNIKTGGTIGVKWNYEELKPNSAAKVWTAYFTSETKLFEIGGSARLWGTPPGFGTFFGIDAGIDMTATGSFAMSGEIGNLIKKNTPEPNVDTLMYRGGVSANPKIAIGIKASGTFRSPYVDAEISGELSTSLDASIYAGVISDGTLAWYAECVWNPVTLKVGGAVKNAADEEMWTYTEEHSFFDKVVIWSSEDKHGIPDPTM